MVTSAKTKLRRKKINSQLIWIISILALVAFVTLLACYVTLFSGFFAVKSFNVNTSNNTVTKDELLEIQKSVFRSFSKRNTLFLSQGELEEYVKANFDFVKIVKTTKNWHDTVTLTVEPYMPAFVGCDKERQFLISCMYSEADGVLYKEAEGDYKDAENLGIYFFEIDREALSFVDQKKNTLNEKLNIDSLEGMRVYSPEDMRAVFALLSYFSKVGYHIKKVELKGLRILELTTDKYIFVLSLQKGYDETVKDYEIFANNEETKKVLQKPDLEVIDLSYKNKIFYKIHFEATSTATKTDITTPTISTTTATVTPATTTF